jgi:Lipopolysaccharide-assembly, LptC-related
MPSSYLSSRREPGGCRRFSLYLTVLALCLPALHAAGQLQQEPPSIRVDADADEAEYSEDTSTASLTGHVRLHATGLPGGVGEARIAADQVRLNFDTGEAEAGPLATLEVPRIRLQGEGLRYNVRTLAVEATDVDATARYAIGDRDLSIYLHSGRIEGTGGDYHLEKTLLTTCDRKKPHYALDVRHARVRLDRNQLIVHGAGIRLWGMSIPLVPRFSMDLVRERRGSGGVTLPGYSSIDGFYVPYRKQFSGVDDPINTMLVAKLGTRHLLSGDFIAEHARPGMRVWADAARHSELEDDVHTTLIHDALPEIGWEGLLRGGVSTFTARVMAGRYRDEIVRTGWRSTSQALTARADWRLVNRSRDGDRAWWVGAGLRGSVYGTGDSYRTVDMRLGAATPLWPRAYAEVELRHHVIAGVTPFEFDDVDLPTEAYVVFGSPITPNWSFEATGRYDLDRGELRDYTIDVARRMHCVIWHVNYRFVNTSIGFSAELTDLVQRRRAAGARRPEGPLPAVPAIAPERMERERRPQTPPSGPAGTAQP